MSLFGKLFNRGGGPAGKPDDAVESLVAAYLHDSECQKHPYFCEDAIRNADSFQRVLSLEMAEQMRALVFVLNRLGDCESRATSLHGGVPLDAAMNRAARFLAATLFKRSFPWDEAGFTALCEGVEGIRFWGYPEPRPLFPAVAARHKKSVGVFSSGQLEVLGRICKAWDAEGGNAAKWARKLHLLMENEAGAPPPRSPGTCTCGCRRWRTGCTTSWSSAS